MTPNGTYLFFEAHAAAALLDGVLVESFALLRERHEFVRLRARGGVVVVYPGFVGERCRDDSRASRRRATVVRSRRDAGRLVGA